MKRQTISVLAGLLLCLHTYAQTTMNMNNNVLTAQQQSLVTLAAYEATGNVAALKPAVEDALNKGWTVNQIKEAFSHLYAYTGFPRSLNGLGVLQSVLAEQEKAGIAITMGKDASPLPADYDALRQGTAVQAELCGGAFRYEFCPAEDYYLKAHLFGDIFARDVLTHQQREMLTLGALAAMEGTESQLGSHKKIAERTGLPSETVEAIALLAHQLGSKSRLHFAIGAPNTAYAQYFIGNSYLEPLTEGISNVTFEPRCRNNWHIHHDARQILVVVSGEGWYQEWGKPAQRLKAGDIVDIPVGVKHWHGATCDSWFQHVVTHVAAAPLPGDSKTGNEWLESVTEEQYNALH